MDNPTTTQFTINTKGNLKELIYVKVVSITGRVVETIRMSPGETLSFGNGYAKGMYFVEVRQGDKKQLVKLVKL
jgi:hypothetical protein